MLFLIGPVLLSLMFSLMLFYGVVQRFSTGVHVLQKTLKLAIPAYLVRGTDPFPLRLSHK